MNDFDEIFEKADHFFDRLFDMTSFRYLPSPDGWRPPMNLYETREDYILIVAIPGMNRRDINVRVDSGRLIISGTSRLPVPKGALRCHNLEITAGAFRRILNIDGVADQEKIEAHYRAGLLIVKIPKSRG